MVSIAGELVAAAGGGGGNVVGATILVAEFFFVWGLVQLPWLTAKAMKTSIRRRDIFEEEGSGNASQVEHTPHPRAYGAAVHLYRPSCPPCE